MLAYSDHAGSAINTYEEKGKDRLVNFSVHYFLDIFTQIFSPHQHTYIYVVVSLIIKKPRFSITFKIYHVVVLVHTLSGYRITLTNSPIHTILSQILHLNAIRCIVNVFLHPSMQCLTRAPFRLVLVFRQFFVSYTIRRARKSALP